MLELDILLQDFLDQGFHKLSLAEVQAFDKLLCSPDSLLLEYLMGRIVPMDEGMAHVVEKIRNNSGN